MIGIDVGTSSCKSLAIDERGQLVGSATAEYGVASPRPLWSEQNPEDWWLGVVQSLQSLLDRFAIEPRRIAAVGLTGQMHGLVLLDRAGRVLRPAILWNDQRTAVECAEITRRVGAGRVIEITGNPILTGFTAPKLAWVQKNEPDVYAKIAHWLLPKDYLRFRLSGELFGDVSDASGTAFFDVGRREWSGDMLAALDLPASWQATITESPFASSRVSAAAAQATGLPEGLPIAAGAGDQAAQAVGGGITDPGPVAVTVGTSGVVFAAADRFAPEPSGRLHTFCHAVPGRWHWMGVMLAAGGSYEWFVTNFGDLAAARNGAGDARETLSRLASEAPPGCEGLFFLPYLSGERTPHADPLARGAFVGLTARHQLAHLARSVMEGVAFGLRDALELMRPLGVALDSIFASGGGVRSDLWRQILADVLGAPIASAEESSGAAQGAALLAGVSVGAWPDVPTAAHSALASGAAVTHPGAAREAYERAYGRFRGLYPALAAHFAAEG